VTKPLTFLEKDSEDNQFILGVYGTVESNKFKIIWNIGGHVKLNQKILHAHSLSKSYVYNLS